MTYFEHQKASKSCPEYQVKKLYRRENRGGFAGGAAWRGFTTHRVAWSRAERAKSSYKSKPPLPPFQVLELEFLGSLGLVFR